jgi:hypothetical protein
MQEFTTCEAWFECGAKSYVYQLVVNKITTAYKNMRVSQQKSNQHQNNKLAICTLRAVARTAEVLIRRCNKYRGLTEIRSLRDLTGSGNAGAFV